MSTGARYSTEPRLVAGELSDIFAPPGAVRRVTSPTEWPAAAEIWRQLILDLEYGGVPPEPIGVYFEEHHCGIQHTWPGKPLYRGFRIHCRGGTAPFSLGAKLILPQSTSPVPVIINGDACWPRQEDITRTVLERGYGLLIFDRTEAARDLNGEARKHRVGGLYDIYPGLRFGAISAWAWAYSRCLDLLYSLVEIDRARIVVSGHSRGGKTCLVAGLRDPRISLINDNGGCAGGGAAYRYVGDGGESIGIVNDFPDWFDVRMRSFVGRESELPFDQHCLLAALAPRPVLLTYALDDRWSNPEGMVQSFWGAREAYRLLGAEESIAFHLRPGGHAHDVDDWQVLLDFADLQWHGAVKGRAFNHHPYEHLHPLFSWSAPQS